MLESSVTEESLDNLPSLICLSVADFFAQGNWTGRSSSVEETLPERHRPQAPPKPLSVTASVMDFCRGINWKGAGLPKAKVLVAATGNAQTETKEPVTKVEPALELTDLSDLF